MADCSAILQGFAIDMGEFPQDRNFYRNVATLLDHRQAELEVYFDTPELKVFAHLMFNSPGMRGNATAEFSGRFSYVSRLFTEGAVSEAGDFGCKLLTQEEELPTLLRARVFDLLVFVERDDPDVWKRVDEALPPLLQSVEVAARWEKYSSDFEDHLRRAMNLAVQFGGNRASLVWKTMLSVSTEFGGVAMQDNRIHAALRVAIEFGRKTGDRAVAREVVETLIPTLRKTIEWACEEGRTALADGAYDCLRAAYEYLGREEQALVSGIEKVESISRRATARDRGFDRYVQLSMGLDAAKKLKSAYPDDTYVDELHRRLKRNMKTAADEGRYDAQRLEASRKLPPWYWTSRYEMVACAEKPGEQVYALATLAWFPLIEDAWDVEAHAPQMSLTELIAGGSFRIDADGQPSGVLRSEYEKLQGRYDGLVKSLLRNYVGILTRPISTRLWEEQQIDTHDVVGAFRESDVVGEERVELLRRGVVALFEQDYATALHLLVMQFEASLRRLYARATHNESREKQGRFKAVSLSEMLRDEEFRIHPGLKRCWAVVFSGGGGLALKRDVDTGMNLRNRVAHGLIGTEGCNAANCFLVFHCLLQLLVVDPTQAWEPSEAVPPEDRPFKFTRHIPGKRFSHTIQVIADEDMKPLVRWTRHDAETGERRRVSLDEVAAADGNEEFLADLVSDVRHQLWREDRESLWEEIWLCLDELGVDRELVDWEFQDKKTDAYIPGVGWHFRASEREMD